MNQDKFIRTDYYTIKTIKYKLVIHSSTFFLTTWWERPYWKGHSENNSLGIHQEFCFT